MILFNYYFTYFTYFKHILNKPLKFYVLSDIAFLYFLLLIVPNDYLTNIINIFTWNILFLFYSLNLPQHIADYHKTWYFKKLRIQVILRIWNINKNVHPEMRIYLQFIKKALDTQINHSRPFKKFRFMICSTFSVYIMYILYIYTNSFINTLYFFLFSFG